MIIRHKLSSMCRQKLILIHDIILCIWIRMAVIYRKHFTSSYTQAYIPKRHTLIQVLPLWKYHCCLLMHICMHDRFGVRIEWRKYLNECMPSGYVSLCIGLNYWHTGAWEGEHHLNRLSHLHKFVEPPQVYGVANARKMTCKDSNTTWFGYVSLQ